MKFYSARAVFLILLFAIPACMTAQWPVKAWLSKDSILIGEPVQLAIEYTLPAEAAPDWYVIPFFPLDEMGLQPEKDSADVLEIILKDGWTKEKVQGELLYRCIFTVTGFVPGQFYLRDIPLGQNNGTLLKAPPVAVRITAPPAKDLAEIKDIIGDSPVTKWLWYLGVALGITLLGVLAFLLYRLYKKKKQQAPVSVQTPTPAASLSPFQEAMAALTSLERSNQLFDKQHKEYFSRLSFILRNYLERKWTIPALESTTGELGAYLSGKMNDAQVQQLKQILSAADMVKFAKSIPTDEQSTRWLQLSKQLLEQLEKQ